MGGDEGEGRSGKRGVRLVGSTKIPMLSMVRHTLQKENHMLFRHVS